MRTRPFAATLTLSATLSAMCALTASLAQAESIGESLRGLAPSEQVQAPKQERIVGGVAAPDGAWPAQVYVLVPMMVAGKAGLGACGGTLIAPNWVLTAAHCFPANEVDKTKDVVVIEGMTRMAGPDGNPVYKAAHRVKIPTVHEAYNPATQENDIALLKLAEPAASPPMPVQLQPDSELEGAERSAVVTGWGRTRSIEEAASGTFVDSVTKQPVNASEVNPDHLMQASLQLVDGPVCKSQNKAANNSIDARNLCAGVPAGGVDTCQGDSGGPLVTKSPRGGYVQIGVTSWGIGCGLKDYSGVYTRVSAFGKWIRGKVGSDLPAIDNPLTVAEQTKRPDPVKPPVQEASVGGATPVMPPPEADPKFDNDAGLSIGFLGGNSVRVGQRVNFHVTTGKPGYLVIFDMAADQSLTQLYPNARSLKSPTGGTLANYLRPDRPLTLPNPRDSYAGFAYEISPPAGKGMMVAILSDQPLKSVEVPPGVKTLTRQSAHDYLSKLARELRQDLSTRAAGGGKPNYSIAIQPYVIQ